jgi:PAS domain S-box-containing protein
MFRQGAVDCVAARGDYQDVLPAVALEHINRWRAQKEKGVVEERIRSLERLNDAIVNEIPAALAVLNAQGQIISLNPEFSRVWNADVDVVTGKPISEVLPHDLMGEAGLAELLEKTAKGAPSTAKTMRTTEEDGTQHSFDVRARLFAEDGHILLSLSDVSERENLMKRIGALQAYNTNIIQGMNSALVVTDTEGCITSGNRMAEHILGDMASPGRTIWEWFPDIEREQVVVSRTLDEGLSFRGAEVQIQMPDGRHLEIGISCAPLLKDEGTSDGVVAIFQDLTEIKALQRQVLQKEKMASIGHLAAGVAHEINNPMGFIHANLFQMDEYLTDIRKLWTKVEELQESIRTGNMEQITEYSQSLQSMSQELDQEFLLTDFGKALQESLEGSERIRHIVRDLRDFSHQDTGERVPSNINQCLDTTVNLVWSMMKHSVVLRKEYSDLPEVLGYPMQLKQVFMNLLVNAYQAIREKLGDSGDTGEIFLCTSHNDNEVRVIIRDSGVGIPQANLDRIFDPFFTTKEVGEGTGLGLSTTFNIIRRHGGTIHVHSQAGEGTTFEISLPLEDDQKPRDLPTG